MTGQISNNLEIGNLTDITTYQAGALQASAQRALRMRCDVILGLYGITKIQWLVIGVTLDAGRAGIRLADVGRRLDLSSKQLSAIVRTLEKQKMIVSVSHPGRQKIIAIHPTFARDCPEIERVLRSALRKAIYTAVTPLEFRVYLKVLYQLSRLERA